MEITLEKIELVKDRTGVSYKLAKEALENAEGNVVDAIISIEEDINNSNTSKVGEKGAVLFDKIKDLIRKSNATKITVKKNGETVLNLPVSVSTIGVVLAPWASLIGVITAFGMNCTIHLIKDDGDAIDITEMAKDNFGDAFDKVSDVAEDVKGKSAGVFESVKNMTSDAIHKMKNDDFDFDIDDGIFEEAVDMAEDNYDDIKEDMVDFADEVKDKSEDVYEDIVDEVKDKTEDTYEDIKDAVKEAINDKEKRD